MSLAKSKSDRRTSENNKREHTITVGESQNVPRFSTPGEAKRWHESQASRKYKRIFLSTDELSDRITKQVRLHALSMKEAGVTLAVLYVHDLLPKLLDDICQENGLHDTEFREKLLHSLMRQACSLNRNRKFPLSLADSLHRGLVEEMIDSKEGDPLHGMSASYGQDDVLYDWEIGGIQVNSVPLMPIFIYDVKANSTSILGGNSVRSL